MDLTPEEIRNTVQAWYGALAQGNTCCGSSSCCEPQPAAVYPPDLLAKLPPEVAGFSLGCANPLAVARLQPGERVLDLGSGGGLDCFLAALQVGEQGQVIGVDMTPAMVRRARRAAARLGLRQVEFRHGYLEHLPVDDASVDVVISNCVINLVPDKNRVFAEMFRVLRPGGRLALADVVSKGPLPAELQADPHAWNACLAGALDVEAYRRGLEAVGFIEVMVVPAGEAGLSLANIAEGIPFSALITAHKPALTPSAP
ncbi:MAG: arsenite methyltransferase [Thermanaerothrix sp.]|nr:arsenite methyltransferase [Thermanaerothrix sp.]